MIQQPLPDELIRLAPQATTDRILAARETLGSSTLILGHHYQRDEIIRWADYRGDSFKLSQIAADAAEASFIVFCGVHFMAESADVLTSERQTVILPNLAAGCSMADMANIQQVERAWSQIEAISAGTTLPITYVNSAANLKALVGLHGGSCCTSSNAASVMKWGLKQRGRLLFFPDQHLGRNTAVQLGLDPDNDMAVWDPALPQGGLQPATIDRVQILLWKGHCSVHGRFTTEQILKARQEYPGITVVVHPECTLDVVKAADLNGSTEFIIKTIANASPGTVWGVGTEVNLVNRLQREYPDRTVFCLDPVMCPCSTMYRIHPRFLLWTLENLVNGHVVNAVHVEPAIREWARVALQRMLAIS